jgi:hypothetical protein
MSRSSVIATALCLPIPDIEALIQGRIIVALPRIFLRPEQRFALYPAELSNTQFSYERYYCSNFLAVAQNAIKSQKPQGILLQPQQISLIPQPEQLTLPLLVDEVVKIQAWAKCEFCPSLDKAENLEALSQLTIWTPEALQDILQQHQHIFLAYLRVYRLSQPQEVSAKLGTQQKLGKFIGLPNSLTVSEANPVLSDRTFSIRKQQLETLQPPPYLELEELLGALASVTNPTAKQLETDIQVFLGWNSEPFTKQLNQNLAWINDIAALGNRSKEKDEGKNNFQAGTDFEIAVRKSLEFLGFTIDYAHKGGAGGLDLFCSKPYALVGECKAGKTIPNNTAVQLLNLGTLRLQSQELFKQATKLIIGPGEPTTQLKDAALVQGMSIINPETLEKLVKLQSKYHNSINLFELKQYLKPGQSDEEVEKYINKVEQDIKLRSQIIQLVKKYLENTDSDQAIVDALHGFIAGASIKIKTQELHEILVELSSPLTGYLGRIKGDDWKRDRFYFLRDLPLDLLS